VPGESFFEEVSSFFISYARDDAAYVARLVDHLRRFDLPVWFDVELAWGGQFPKEIQWRLRYALAIIVVMSPAAGASDWVGREILEGQRHDRQFLPILLSGERLFLLASSQYFDARGGALPGSGEMRQLKAMCHKDSAGSSECPPIVLHRSTHRPASTALTPVEASSWKVRSFLAEGQIEYADILTTTLLLETVGRLDDGWMRQKDGACVPFSLLDRIDAAWSEYSGGTQGFRAQLSRRLTARRRGSSDPFSDLALSLGWRSVGDKATPRYGKFINRADSPADYPVGFFPTLRNPQVERFSTWHDRWRLTVMAVHVRLAEWSDGE